MGTTASGLAPINEIGRALRPARPTSFDHTHDRPQHINYATDREVPPAITIRQEGPTAFIVFVEGEGVREFPSYRAARGFASGRRMTSGWPIVDLTGAPHG